MNSIPKTVLTILVANGSLATVPAFADSLTVNNPSFETDQQTVTPFFSSGGAGSTAVAGWAIAGNGTAGVQNGPAYYTIFGPVPDGTQLGYLNNSPASDTTLSQILSATWQPSTTYILSIDVGGRTDGFNPGTAYSITLYAGSTTLATVTPIVPPTGSWQTISADYTSPSVVDGSPLEITLDLNANPTFAQLDFDNVRLEAVPVVPEPSVWGFAGLFLTVPVAMRLMRKSKPTA